jgi:uncharacterized membrane protein SirB2
MDWSMFTGVAGLVEFGCFDDKPLPLSSGQRVLREYQLFRSLHVLLAYLTVVGFLLRAVWAFTDSPIKNHKLVKVLPHVVDTLLLVLGVVMAYQLSISPFSGWLFAKLVGLVAYIGFGVLTMRGSTTETKVLGLAGALVSVGYIFAVAFSRNAWPF